MVTPMVPPAPPCAANSLSSILNGAGGNVEPVRNFFVCALEPTELLQLYEINLYRLAAPAPSFPHLSLLPVSSQICSLRLVPRRLRLIAMASTLPSRAS